MLEMKLLVSYFVWYFDATLCHEQEPLYEDRFVSRRGSLFIKVAKRHGNEG